MTTEELSNLTPEEKRIAIAEACGFIATKEDQFPCRKIWVKPTESIGTYWTAGDLPDYLNSLDAMHEAEKTLTRDKLDRYADILCDMVAAGDPDPNICGLITLTAAQRADAFLLSL